jgi:PAS domain S-box-containing protein
VTLTEKASPPQQLEVDAQLLFAQLSLACAAAEIGTWDLDPKSGAILYDRRCAMLFGLADDEPFDYPKLLDKLHPDDRASTDAAVQRALGGGGRYDVEFRLRPDGGGERWISATGQAFFEHDGRPIRFIGTVRDITERKRSEVELAALNRIGHLLAAELDTSRLISLLIEEATALCEAKFGAYFYNVTDERGESYMLYALAGAPREAFARFGMPRNTAVFAPTFAGERIVRSDDITKDPRYGKSGPHYGMPKGHLPVRSYLAVPVVSRSGRVLGGSSSVIPSRGASPNVTRRPSPPSLRRPPSPSTTRRCSSMRAARRSSLRVARARRRWRATSLLPSPKAASCARC